jgi:hypothetical protein
MQEVAIVAATRTAIHRCAVTASGGCLRPEDECFAKPFAIRIGNKGREVASW